MSGRVIAVVAALAATVAAQTFTECNPLNTTCPDNPALGTTYSVDYTKDVTEFNPHLWNVTAGETLITFGDQGAELPITKEGDTVTVKSNFYIFFGQLEIIMKAAAGQGIISTAILLSDDLDEIDWEIMGGNTTHVENNYYGWGNTSQRFATYDPLDGPQMDYHNYTINWTAEKFELLLNGNIVRTVSYDEPGLYPQTPCRVQFGIWAAGASESKGTVEWAGGPTDFDKTPFTMYIQSMRITDGTSNSSSYTYGDHSGSYKSIKSNPGQSAAYKQIHKKSSLEEAQDKWAGLSTGAKIGIACGVLGGAAILLILLTAYCVVQRKKGRQEKAMADQEWDRQHNELLDYKRMMARGDFAVSSMGHGQQQRY